ncbi:hypothetical protein KORDIASMS9_01087 [Kordia sp. SMS9]|uniref:hypothetical protein n=1 Tax=Kordia sp. SMS9 TaxID=2282170 RepID=UPI000E0D93A6|nr:hypothetical protein [Kordia sp. SMS9]AXG68870.1 hypothetical protein KORDIASMS9_01087 [Kordia sp. SMS9]
MINKSLFPFLLVVILTYSCNSTQEKKVDITKEKATEEPKTITMPADTIFIQSPPKIMTAPRILGSRVLYANCRNTLQFDALEGFSDFKIMTDANFLVIPKSGSTPNYWEIIPKTTGNHTINYSATLDTIPYNWSETVSVIMPPKPSVELFINSKKTDGSIPVPKTSRIIVNIIPDPNFAALMPEEANYSITSIDVLAQLSLGPPTKVNSVSVKGKSRVNVALGTQVRQSRPGTKVMLRINEVYRLTSMKRRIPDRRFTEVERIVSLTVK